MRNRRLLVGTMIGLMLVGAAGCAMAEPVKAVASFSILADLVRQVGGERVRVQAMVGPGMDAHVFSPAPGDARKIANAGVVFVNGLGLDGWMDRLARASGTKAPLIAAAKGIRPLTGPGRAGEAPRAEHGANGTDPHAWQDVANAEIYVANIRDGLIAVDPAGRGFYDRQADAYLARLNDLDRQLRAAIARIPAGRRKIVTTHDAFAYFARAYGLQFLTPEGVSTEAEASARELAGIIKKVKAENVPAVFLENITDNRLTEAVARETGARIGGALYSDALSGPDGPAPTYIAMMRHNASTLVRALAPGS